MIQTPEQLQHDITLGLLAEQLMDCEFFKVVINSLRDRHVMSLLSSEPKAADERERLYYAVRGIDEVYTEVKKLVEIKDYAQHLAAQDQTQPDEED